MSVKTPGTSLKTTTMFVLAAMIATAATAACRDKGDDDDAQAAATPDAGASAPPGSLPTFDFDGGGGTAPPPSNGADTGAPTFNFDAAAVQPPPPLPPEKRAIWAVDDQRHLVRILAEDPKAVTDVGGLDFPGNEQVLGMDFRPSNKMLYALTNGSRLYTIDLMTAKVTVVGTAPTSPWLLGQAFGVDFNPVPDLLRVHSDVDQNLRISPMTGAVVGTDKSLNFAATDPNAGQSPNLIGTAYTNSIAGATTTVLYAIDSTRNLLTKVAPPNDGTVATIGSLGVNIIEHAGFDIWGPDGSLEAYAALRVEGADGTGLYKIDLNSGAATLVGPIVHGSPLRGIAIEP